MALTDTLMEVSIMLICALFVCMMQLYSLLLESPCH